MSLEQKIAATKRKGEMKRQGWNAKLQKKQSKLKTKQLQARMKLGLGVK